MNLLGLRKAVFTMLGEDESAPTYWKVVEIDRYINDAYRQAARDTGALEIASSIVTTAGLQTYEVPNESNWPPFRVTFGGRKLYSTTKWELDRMGSNWENLTGFVSHYITTLQNNRTLRLYKAPDADSGNYDMAGGDIGIVAEVTGATMASEFGTDTSWTIDGIKATFTSEFGITVNVGGSTTELVIYAKKTPTDMVSDTDKPEFPAWSHMGLAFAAASRALLKHGEQRDDILSAFYNQLAMDYAKVLTGLVANRAPERTHAMSSGPSRVPRKPRPWDQTIVP